MHCHGTLRHFVGFWFETAAVMKQEGRCTLEEMWVWLFVLRLHVLTPHLAPLLDGGTSKRQEEVNILKWWKELRNVAPVEFSETWDLRRHWSNVSLNQETEVLSWKAEEAAVYKTGRV